MGSRKWSCYDAHTISMQIMKTVLASCENYTSRLYHSGPIVHVLGQASLHPIIIIIIRARVLQVSGMQTILILIHSIIMLPFL